MDLAKVITILPAYNEVQELPLLLEQYKSVKETHPNLYVVVIDDGSTDGTVEAVNKIKTDWMEVLPHGTNQGLAQGMRTGFARALELAADGDFVMAMDADNTHMPDQLPQLLEKMREGNDVVIASRFRKGAKMYGIPPHRQLFSRGVSVLFQLFAPMRGVRDFSCGYRLYRAETLRQSMAHWGDDFISEDGFAGMTEILYKLNVNPGARFAEVPMTLRYDQKIGATKMPFLQNIKDMFRLMWQNRGYRK